MEGGVCLFESEKIGMRSAYFSFEGNFLWQIISTFHMFTNGSTMTPIVSFSNFRVMFVKVLDFLIFNFFNSYIMSEKQTLENVNGELIVTSWFSSIYYICRYEMSFPCFPITKFQKND